MPDQVIKLPAPNTLPDLILTLVALSGEFPTKQVSRLPSTKAYQQKVVKRLKKELLVYTYSQNSLRGLRLTADAKSLLSADRPEQFAPLFTGDTTTNAPKYSVPHRLRLHRMAEVLVTMHNAGVLVFPWEKIAVFQSSPPPAYTRVTQPAYYSSREVKEIGPQSSMIRGSRSTGVLLADGGIFVVYNTGNFQMKWEFKAELRLKFFLQTELCRQRLPAQYMDAGVDAVVFGAEMRRLDTLMGIGDGLSHNNFVLDGGFEHFYFFPSDHKGEALARLLCDSELRASLDTLLLSGLRPPNPGLPIENDGLEGDTPVLFGYLCDMPRLRRFDNALTIHGRDGIVICFDFQEEAYRRCLGPRIQFQCLDLEAVERSVFPSPEKRLSSSPSSCPLP